MRLNKKILLDRYLAKPAAFLLNLFVWPLGKMIPRNHDDSAEKVKVIAIAKFLGMGSILRATPMIRALKQKYPRAQYIFITTLKNKPLAENIPLFDKLLFIRDTSMANIFVDTLALIFKLWQYRIDLYFDLEVYSGFSAVVTILSLARNRYGFYRVSTRFRTAVNTHMLYFNNHQHISKVYLQFARACGIKNMDYKIEKIQLPARSAAELAQWMGRQGISEQTPCLLINPNASDLLLERRWPGHYFAALINALAVHWKNPICLVGSPEERPYVTGLWNSLSEEAKAISFNMAGEVSLEAVMALIERAKLMITNDSGLYHIAVSFATPVISLWGPASPEHYADAASGDNIIFYSKEIYCSPCVHITDFASCRGNNVCMKYISPKEVYQKACGILKIKPQADTSRMDAVYEKECRGNFDITIRSPHRGAA